VLDVGIAAARSAGTWARPAAAASTARRSARGSVGAAPYYRRIEVADLNVTALDALFAGRRYDAIICADVLEHLPRPTAVLDSCRTLLADDGRLLLSIPNVAYSGLIAELLAGEFRYRTEGLLDRTHVRFFTGGRRCACCASRAGRWTSSSRSVSTCATPSSAPSSTCCRRRCAATCWRGPTA